jgi:hypothetical protein
MKLFLALYSLMGVLDILGLLMCFLPIFWTVGFGIENYHLMVYWKVNFILEELFLGQRWVCSI